jgi:hypothetical protein
MTMSMKVFTLIPVIIYGIAGVISLIMAFKNLSLKRFIEFHEKAANVQWEDIDKPLQSVILALMKVSGLGFLVVAMLLLIFPVVNYFMQNEFIKYSIPVIALIYCSGLFLVNFYLHKQTDSETPWRGSLIVVISISAGIFISFFL